MSNVSKKKQGIPVIAILFIIIVIIVIVFGCKAIFTKDKQNEISNVNNTENKSANVSNNNITTKSKENTENSALNEEFSYDIKSTENNRIEKDEIEAENIHMYAIGDQLQVTTKLKNNSGKTLKGLFIEIKLLDDRNNEIAAVVKDLKETINPKESKEIVTYMMGLENKNSIKNAKISVLEKYE